MTAATDPAPIPTTVSFPTGVVECRAWLDRKGFRPAEGERQHWVHPDGRHGRFEVKAWREAVLTITKENAVTNKHSQGPFVVVADGREVRSAGGLNPLALVVGANDGERLANAKLFAASSQMLGALVQMRDAFNAPGFKSKHPDGQPFAVADAFTAVCAAIEAATKE